jgi:hypothetical protein
MACRGVQLRQAMGALAGGGGRKLGSGEEECDREQDEGAASDHDAVWIGNGKAGPIP